MPFVERDELDRQEQYQAKKRYQDMDMAEQYDQERFSSIIGKWVDYLEKNTLYKAMHSLGLDQDDTILDIPLGTGRISAFLLSKGFQVAGADISEEMMAFAKERIHGFSHFKGAYRMDAENMSFPDGSFDGVVSVRFMVHLPPPVRIRVLKEMRRVSRKGVVIGYCISDFTTAPSIYLQKMDSRNKYPLYMGTRKDMKKEMSEAGLEIIKEIPMLRFVSVCHFLALRPKK